MTPRNISALMRHAAAREFARQNRIIMSALTGGRPGDGIDMTETRIYVGLNDAETGEQLHDTETYLSALKNICRDFHTAFSVDVEQGGYYHEDGRYTEETSLVLVLIDADKDVVSGIADSLRSAFHQESVLVTENRITGRFIGGETRSVTGSAEGTGYDHP